MAGPGTHLTAILADWFGIRSKPSCPCRKMARKMDERGPDWCEGDGMAKIVAGMKREHAKRWRKGTLRIPFVEASARTLVRLACRRARACR